MEESPSEESVAQALAPAAEASTPSQGSEPAQACAPEPVEAEEEPASKRRRSEEPEARLEQRLGGILCCAVCLELPPAAVYQCTNGHLMCAACFTHVVADARLRDEAAACPHCRVEMSRSAAVRNLAVENTVCELPAPCRHCARVFPRHRLRAHEDTLCDEREYKYKFRQMVVGPRGGSSPCHVLFRIVSQIVSALRRRYLPAPRKRTYRRLTGCQYAVLGCPWRGPAHEARAHAAQCGRPARPARDVLPALQEREAAAAAERALHAQLIDLLSYEKITFNDLQLKPYRTEEFVHKLYYETSRFTAFAHQWVVKAHVNANQRDPTQSTAREITYQLILKSRGAALNLQWVCVRGPYGEARMTAGVCSHRFADDAADSPAAPLPLADPADTNRLLANKAIHFRLIMFQSMK